MQLQKLLTGILDKIPLPDVEIKNIALDSREVKPGTLFLAYPGTQSDGRKYIEQAIQAGACMILREDEQSGLLTEVDGVPIISIHHLAEKVGNIAANFFQHPSKQLHLVGITGTNGKTTCCLSLAQALERLGKHCGFISTIATGFIHKSQPATHTTPDAITLQRILRDMVEQKAGWVTMEVSSHALAQGRVNYLNYDIAVFTNFTRDHLDYHGSMDAYWEAKKSLFSMPGLRHAVINLDDPKSKELIAILPKSVKVYGYSLNPDVARNVSFPIISANNITPTADGFHLFIDTPWGKNQIYTHRLGRFNLSNLLVTATCLGVMEISFSEIVAQLEQLQPVQGRMQKFISAGRPTVVVDYAHTPDALQKALLALQEHQQGKIWCVFGCGGNRDRGKRALMGEVATEYADEIIITNDNPRNEKPEVIVQDILQGINKNYRIEYDRANAISLAIHSANANDIVLVAGKGHEDYQILGDNKFDFSDIEWVKHELNIE